MAETRVWHLGGDRVLIWAPDPIPGIPDRIHFTTFTPGLRPSDWRTVRNEEVWDLVIQSFGLNMTKALEVIEEIEPYI